MEILKSLFALTPIGFAVFIAGAIVSLAALVFMRKPESAVPPAPPPITVVVKVDNWNRSPPQEVRDAKGKTGVIEIIVLSNDFSWAFQSHTKVEREGRDADIPQHLMTPGISSEIKKYTDVIAVGAASNEGVSTNPTEEANRAARRADQLQLWIKEYVATSNSLHRLALGYYKGNDGNTQSSDQRRVVIVGVLKKDQGLDLREALRTSLTIMSTFPFKLDEYSSFELQQAR